MPRIIGLSQVMDQSFDISYKTVLVLGGAAIDDRRQSHVIYAASTKMRSIGPIFVDPATMPRS